MRVHWRIGVRFALRIIRSNRLTAVIYTHVLRVDKKSPRPVGVGRGQKRQPFRLREEKVVRLSCRGQQQAALDCRLLRLPWPDRQALVIVYQLGLLQFAALPP